MKTSSANLTTNRNKTPKTGMRKIFRVLFAATLAVFTLAAPSVHAADATWTGATSGDWSIGTNWSGGIVPGSTSATDASLVTFNNNTNTTITYPSGSWVVSGITFTGNATGAFTIGTNTLNLATGGTGVHTLQTTADVLNAQTITAPLFLRSTGTYTLLSNATAAAATLTFNATIDLSAASGLILDGSNTGNNLISGTILSATGNLTKQGAGQWILTGSSNYSGTTTIAAGVLSVGTLANGGIVSSIGDSGSAATNLILAGGTLKYIGAGNSTDRLFSAGTSGGTLDSSGSGAVNFTNTGAMGFNAQTGSRTLTLTGNNTGANTLAAVIGDNSGATALTKSGGGNWTISGVNTYTGTTTVTAGTLVLSAGGSIASSAVIQVQSGATLDASAVPGGFQLQSGQKLQNKGTFTGSLTALSGSTYAPGNSPGIATQDGALALNSGSTLEWELVANSSATPGTNFDQTQFVTGGLTIQSGVIASLVFNYAGSSVDWTNAFWDTNQSWTLFSGAASLSTVAGIFGTTTVGVDSLGATLSAGRGAFSFSSSGNDVLLNYTAVPESATWVLLAGAGTFLMVMRRRFTKA